MTRLAGGFIRTARRLALGAAVTAAAATLVVPTAFASPETDAADAINQAWDSAGGSDSPVGSKDGDVYQAGIGYGQKFTDGKIFFVPDAGAHLIYGAILDKYESLGGPADSDLGFPNINEVAGLVGPNSRVSTFNASDKPAIFWTDATGAWAVRGAINAAWDKLGGSAGKLGVPTEDERYDGDVVSQKFTGGEVSWNRSSNTFTTQPAEWADELVGLEVPLDPTTLINLTWRTSGGLGGPLGARQGEQTAIGDNGAAQGYAGGKIFYSPQTGAHALTGAILSKYESVGGPTGDLGYPIGTESEGGAPNSRVSAFSAPDKPVIFWTPDSGAIVVRGAINAAWDKLGGAGGTLGVPSDEQTVSGDVVTQKFNGGEISWNEATKQFSTKPAELAADLNGLELPDAVAQTPAGTTDGGGSAKRSGWHWWWLAIILPLLLLLGLLALWAQRRGRAAHAGGRDHRPANEERVSSYTWSELDAAQDDEDAVTAPTRVPSDDEFAGFARPSNEGGEWDREGRHSVGDDAESAWQLGFDELKPPGRRRAAEDWTVDETAVEVVEEADGGWDLPALPDIRRDIRGYYDEDVSVESPEWAAEPEFKTGGEESVQDAEEPWHPAIHLPLADPYQPPEGYFIKANTHSGLYYLPDSALYETTVPEVWFASEEVAQANGFVRAPE